jgi:hypothetical protein
MPGGVGGVAPQGVPLSRSLPLKRLSRQGQVETASRDRIGWKPDLRGIAPEPVRDPFPAIGLGDMNVAEGVQEY